ncbi:MAG: hypothetical protein HQM09_19350 [Candidatus Riflebacteria bacterium]|nr:hypothetical protein [Candidatus Riflebacteria bacterium]
MPRKASEKYSIRVLSTDFYEVDTNDGIAIHINYSLSPITAIDNNLADTEKAGVTAENLVKAVNNFVPLKRWKRKIPFDSIIPLRITITCNGSENATFPPRMIAGHSFGGQGLWGGGVLVCLDENCVKHPEVFMRERLDLKKGQKVIDLALKIVKDSIDLSKLPGRILHLFIQLDDLEIITPFEEFRRKPCLEKLEELAL